MDTSICTRIVPRCDWIGDMHIGVTAPRIILALVRQPDFADLLAMDDSRLARGPKGSRIERGVKTIEGLSPTRSPADPMDRTHAFDG